MAGPARPTAKRSKAVAWRDLPVLARALYRLAPLSRAKLDRRALAAVIRAERGPRPAAERFVTSDGAALALRRYLGGCEIDLVLVHGAACYGAQFHRMAHGLAARGIADVHVLDMRGHGDSRGLALSERLLPSRLADDVADYIEHLAAHSPDRRIVLGGHSAGGGLVLAVSERPAARHLAGWLLLAPFLGFRSEALRPFFGGWTRHIARTKIVLLALATAMGIERFNGVQVAQFAAEPTARDSRFVRRWSFATMLGFGCGAAQPRIDDDTPVLLLAGSSDECFRVEHYSIDLARIAPHAELHEIANAGHWDILVLPQAIDAVGRWLERAVFDAGGVRAPQATAA